jgi:hypothetical protein
MGVVGGAADLRQGVEQVGQAGVDRGEGGGGAGLEQLQLGQQRRLFSQQLVERRLVSVEGGVQLAERAVGSDQLVLQAALVGRQRVEQVGSVLQVSAQGPVLPCHLRSHPIELDGERVQLLVAAVQSTGRRGQVSRHLGQQLKDVVDVRAPVLERSSALPVQGLQRLPGPGVEDVGDLIERDRSRRVLHRDAAAGRDGGPSGGRQVDVHVAEETLGPQRDAGAASQRSEPLVDLDGDRGTGRAVVAGQGHGADPADRHAAQHHVVARDHLRGRHHERCHLVGPAALVEPDVQKRGRDKKW